MFLTQSLCSFIILVVALGRTLAINLMIDREEGFHSPFFYYYCVLYSNFSMTFIHFLILYADLFERAIATSGN
jgi:hypothetical protein